MQSMAERAFVGRNTITRLERGDPGVSIGIYATVLFILGLADRLGEVANPGQDALGIAKEEELLPKRVRNPPGARS